MVHLERFSTNPLNATVQSQDIRRFVNAQADWLTVAQPDTVQRYRDPVHALYNTLRLARADNNYHPQCIREEARGPVVGLASIIRRQTFLHPEDGSIVIATDLDYVLNADAKVDLHKAVADELLKASGKLALISNAVSSRHITDVGMDQGAIDISSTVEKVARDPVFTVVKDGQPNPPLGLTDRLEPLGNLGALAIPALSSDTYNIAKGGGPVQVYYLDREVRA